MSTDPFVPARLEDAPRQEQNLAPGVRIPAARSWRLERPGALRGGQPVGELLGTPGPNIGYALTLVERSRSRVALAPFEHPADAEAVIGELAMKRAASYGRAPVMADVDCAMLVLGYQGGVDPDFATWRTHAVLGAAHEYARRRAICDGVDLDELRLTPGALSRRVPSVRSSLRDAATRELASLTGT